jgi:hypothetical protein
MLRFGTDDGGVGGGSEMLPVAAGNAGVADGGEGLSVVAGNAGGTGEM